MIRYRTGMGLLLVFSFLIALSSYRFLAFGWPKAFPDFSSHLDGRWWAFTTHVTMASVALLIGVLQLFDTIRCKWPVIHRWLGRLYVIAVLTAGVAAFLLAINAIGGIVASLGFGLLAILWIVFTLQGFRLARSHRFAEHRRWMILSFALTFAAVTLRLYLVGFLVAGIDYTTASIYLSWMCWVPNLLFAWWWLKRA